MADEDKEKAEKVAAAKKRFEQLKKQKAKREGAPRKTKKSKEESSDAAKALDEAGEDAKVDEAVEEGEDAIDSVAKATDEHGKPNGESSKNVQREQAVRIEFLEKENTRLENQLEGRAKTSGETEPLSKADPGANVSKEDENFAELERLRSENTSLQRQVVQLQSQRRRTSSTASPPSQVASDSLTAQLASKTNTIDTLELEVSNLRHSLSTSESRANDLESRLQSSEESTKAADQRLADLKTSLETANKDNNSKDEDKSNDDTRIALLTSDLSAAQHNATSAQSRIESLEKKIETLSTLHREAESRSQSQMKTRISELDKSRAETTDLRRRLNSLTTENARLRDKGSQANSTTRKSVEGDSGGVEELEEEERAQLHARIRELESEVFDARRGAWRERRRDMQADPAPVDEDNALGSPGSFDEIDLEVPAAGAGMADRRRAGSSGVGGFAAGLMNAFTGSGASGTRSAQGRAPSLGKGGSFGTGVLGDEDDMDFDEGAFAAAQEAEAKARIERVKDIKRGLNSWKGWRVDLVDVRGGAMSGVFDV